MNPLTVLVAEDELLIRMGIKLSVNWEKLGMRLAADAANGEEAWRLFQALRPDVVLADIRMPGMDGLTLTERVREADPNCYVLVITCLNDFDTLRRAMRAGASDYVLKSEMTPETLEIALEKVKRAAPNGGRAREPAAEEAPRPRARWIGAMSTDEEASDMMLSTLRQLLADAHPRDARVAFLPGTRVLVAELPEAPEDEETYERTLERVAKHYQRLFSGEVKTRCGRVEDGERAEDAAARLMRERGSNAPKREEIRRAMRYVARNYATNLSVADVARHVGLSPNYLSNLFHRETGTTLTAYMARYRVERAKELLERTELPAYEVAEKCGFLDDAYFSRVFKQYTGMRPSAYRAARGASRG